MTEKNSSTEFKLSDPGATLISEPRMLEYLRQYELPAPPAVRYGCLRFPSPQKKNGVGLFGQAWVPQHCEGTVVLLHGYAEHAGNYARLINDLVDAKFAVACLDFRGHGLSEGPRAHLETPSAYAEDMERFLSLVRPGVAPHRPLFLWAHSMGGMVALQLLLRRNLSQVPAAAVLTSPLLGFPEVRGIQKIAAKFAPLLAKLVPSLPIPHGLQEHTLSADKDYILRRRKDPLIFAHTTPRWYLSARTAIQELQRHAVEFRDRTPILCLLAGDERIANLQEARKFAIHAFSDRRHHVVEFPGRFHELEKEPEARARVISESLAWFRKHLN